MNKNIKTPIGLETIVGRVEEICSSPAGHCRCGIYPNHFLINLDKGNGQTTLTSYIADAYQEYGIRHFGGLDTYLEYSLDGSMSQLEDIFDYIHDSAAVYTNEYEGVIAMDVTALAAPGNAAQMALFLKEIAHIGEHATFVFYVPAVINSSIANLIKKIREVFHDRDVEVIKVDAYSEQNLVDIIKNMLEEAGVEVVGNVDDSIINILRSEGASNIKDAKYLTKVMIKNADFSSFVPVITAEIIDMCFGSSVAKKEVK